MNTNPFHSKPSYSIFKRELYPQCTTDPALEGRLYEECVPPEINPPPPPVPRRFINQVCIFGATFVIVFYAVFREIQHNQELYHMSQMVAAAEAQARECREQLRLAEVREAQLKAELQGRVQIAKAEDTPPN
jgi:hypothetical protein